MNFLRRPTNMFMLKCVYTVLEMVAESREIWQIVRELPIVVIKILLSRHF